MLRGFYTVASGMQAQQRRQEVLSNNMANVNTPGYKADDAAIRAFPEMLTYHMGKKTIPVSHSFNIPVNEQIGSFNTGVYVQETIPNHAQGDIRETNVSTDLALVNGKVPDETGSLFFTVQLENGDTAYTRNGHFTVDQDGYLTAGSGHYVLDSAGNRIQTDGMTFTVSSNGVVTTAAGNTAELGMSYAADANDLVKDDYGFFTGDAGEVPAGAEFTIQQGALEGSNVDAMQTMTEMMSAYRSFEMNQRVLKAYDQSMGKAVSEIGRIG
ncbi:Flagellar hook-basal body complex protein FlhO [Lentibacillus sp. JNUCC-1]|uniref:flagellar hook-basal body protein n=1 Tax=Lentibacillus sp. JNUCC-1 TaxID=2654513 RepID=UPI0012E766A0|nr:flagellar hook-basal body protein [Lentibacillus sp. JNUCC-1]MUV37364.1 Flagellar hook-basal body complex protein FlhO [Lentibacillus sp. JNUCC-1]